MGTILDVCRQSVRASTTFTNINATMKPTSASKIKTYIRPNIIPTTQSSGVGSSVSDMRVASRMPRAKIQLPVNSRYPVNGTPRGIERCCLLSSRELSSLGEVSDRKSDEWVALTMDSDLMSGLVSPCSTWDNPLLVGLSVSIILSGIGVQSLGGGGQKLEEC